MNLAERFCHSRIRNYVYSCFPPFFVVAAIGIFSLPGLLWSPAVTLGWLIHAILTGRWYDNGNIGGLIILGPIMLLFNLIGLLHLPMLAGREDDLDAPTMFHGGDMGLGG